MARPLVDTIDATVKAQLSEEPFQRDPAVVSRALPLLKVVNRYFDAEIRGWEDLPAQASPPVLTRLNELRPSRAVRRLSRSPRL